VLSGTRGKAQGYQVVTEEARARLWAKAGFQRSMNKAKGHGVRVNKAQKTGENKVQKSRIF